MRVVLMTFVLAGCSTTTLKLVDCDPEACREGFGYGWTCGDEGYCEHSETPARCDHAEPSDLFELDPAERHVFLTLTDRAVDDDVERSYALAARQVNDQGGIDGKQVGLVQCTYELDSTFDDLTRAEAAAEIAAWSVDALGMKAVLGPSSSSQVGAVWDEVSAQSIVISPSATSPALTYLDGLEKTDETPGTLWRTASPDSVQGRAISDFLSDEGVTSVTLVVQTGPYGDGLAEVFIAEFQTEGTTINQLNFDPDSTTERDEAVSTAGTHPVEYVLFISSEIVDAVAFLNVAAVQSGYQDKGLFLPDGAAEQGLITGTPTATALYPHIRGTRPARPAGVVYEAFRGAYAAAYPGEDAGCCAWTAHAYDAAWLAFYGTAYSVGTEGVAVRDGLARGLRHISSGDPYEVRPGTWQNASEVLAAGTSIDLTGASGELDYDPESEETEGPVEIWGIASNGQSLEALGVCTALGCTLN